MWEDTLLQQFDRLGTWRELLDRLNEFDAGPGGPRSFSNYVYVAPVRLLGRALHTLGDKQKPARLYDWLSAGRAYNLE